MLLNIIREYGIVWIFYRIIYVLKLKILKIFPITEKLYEKKIDIKRIDIFNTNSHELKNFLKKLPQKDKKKIVEGADKVIDGKIKAFTSLELNYGNPIKWNYNPLTDFEIDNTMKWYKIPDFKKEQGDIKVIWEPSRFSHFYLLSRAYLLTNNEKYYLAFSTQIKEWLKQNPYSYGANYKCGQEASLRMINVLMNYSIFKNENLISKEDEENIKQFIKNNYKKVISNFFYAHKCVKNNHTFTELTGLIIGAWCIKDNKRLEQLEKLLNNEIKEQFFKDGGYKQYSFTYQRFSLNIIECILKLNEKTNISLDEESKERILKSVLLMNQFLNTDGDLPNYGSNDGALIFPVTSCSYRDFRPVLNTIYKLLKGKVLYKEGKYDEELIWFCKESKYKELEKIEKKSINYPKAGLFKLSLKNGLIMLVLNDFKNRPGQMDQMHLDLWYKGINVFCDSGTYSYADELGKKMALTKAHNTVLIDDKDQMAKKGAFFIYNWSKSKIIEFNKEIFKGTMISKNGYIHTREIKIEENGFSLKDEVVGDGKECNSYIHTPCDVKITENGFILFNNNELLLKVRVKGEISVQKSYRSLFYKKKDEINCVIIKNKIKNRLCINKIDITLK